MVMNPVYDENNAKKDKAARENSKLTIKIKTPAAKNSDCQI